MIKLNIILITSIILLSILQVNGQAHHADRQDTIVFQKKNNRNKQFKIPLNNYPIYLKQMNKKKIRVILNRYTDSTLIVKTYSFKKGEERNSKKQKIVSIYSDSTLTRSKFDSLTSLVLYSIQDTININQIDKLIISNGFRKEMRNILEIIEWSAVAWFVVGIPAIALFKSVAYFTTWSTLGISIVVVSIIIENKKLKFDKWEILNTIPYQ